MRVALAEFFLTENYTFVFIIDPQNPGTADGPTSIRAGVTLEEIRSIRPFIWGFGKNRRIVQRNETCFHEIAAKLLQPVLECVGQCDILYIVPHKELHYLPLHAVEINGKSICERFAVSYLPSASMIQTCQENNVRRGNEDFRYSRIFAAGTGAKEDLLETRKKYIEEVETVVDYFEESTSTVLRGAKATRSAFMDKSPDCDLVHIAAHGYFNAEEPLESGLFLAARNKLPSLFDKRRFHNHVLSVSDLSRVDLHANLVVLNGCFTGMSEVRSGDELLGLARGLFIAGVPSMMLSL